MADFAALPGPDLLPVAQRFALAYAPRRSRAAVLALWLLDQRLATVLRARGEVLIAQIKLAWWRDRLLEDPALWPQGEPLLGLLAAGPVPPAAFGPLVDGWERLLEPDLSAAAVDAFAAGRAAAWSAVAKATGADAHAIATAALAAREVTYLDLALHLYDEAEARAARQLALAARWAKPRLPRALRPLAVIHGLSHRALRQGQGELLADPGAGLTGLRIGLLGR